MYNNSFTTNTKIQIYRFLCYLLPYEIVIWTYEYKTNIKSTKCINLVPYYLNLN